MVKFNLLAVVFALSLVAVIVIEPPFSLKFAALEAHVTAGASSSIMLIVAVEDASS